MKLPIRSKGAHAPFTSHPSPDPRAPVTPEERGGPGRKWSGGLLGADFAVENGRYRFKKVYGGLNWNPELRSPLTEPGVDVKTGE